MKKKPGSWKEAEKTAKAAGQATSETFKKIGSKAKQTFEDADKKIHLSDRVDRVIKAGGDVAHDLDERYKLREKGKVAIDKAAEGIEAASEYIDESGLKDKARDVGNKITETIIDPVSDYLDEKGVSEKLDDLGRSSAEQYGKARAWMKPYFAPETPEELLRTTKDELVYINACILQISCDEAEQLANKLGNAIAAKIAGATSVGALLGMVSTFGTASTGTAIASLGGAAQTTATMYWVGSLAGGGVAAGAVITGGVAIVVGFGVYKLLSSQARKFEDLSDEERHLVEASGFLIAAINDRLDGNPEPLTVDEAELLYQNTLKPLHESLVENADDICGNLDAKNSLLFKQHAIKDFENSVLDGFEFFINEETQKRRYYPEYAIVGVIYALLTGTAVDDSRESQLALSAIRRTKSEWGEASEAEIGQELSALNPEQLKGVANNAKGIYHEMLFVDNYNRDHDDTYTELFGATNHPGADIRIVSRDTGEVIDELQLKATSNKSLVQEHLQKYPDIEVLATSEVAIASGLAGDSGISYPEITETMDDTIGDIVGNTPLDRATESAELSGIVAAGREAIKVLSGKQTGNQAAIQTVKATAVTATSTALVAFFFG